MAVIVKAHTFSPGGIIYSSSVNKDVDDLYTLQGGNINSANIANSGVGANNFETSAVQARAIDATAVTTAKIDTSAVTTAKIDTSAVTAAKMADIAVQAKAVDHEVKYYMEVFS